MMHLPEIRARAESPRLWELLRRVVGTVAVARLVEKPGDFAPSDEALRRAAGAKIGGSPVALQRAKPR